MTQPINIEQLKKAAREKFTAENNKYLWTTVTEQIDEINPFIDEIVTSTYLQAVEDCVLVLESERDAYPASHSGNERPRYYYNDAIERLQSLKQTKDV